MKSVLIMSGKAVKVTTPGVDPSHATVFSVLPRDQRISIFVSRDVATSFGFRSIAVRLGMEKDSGDNDLWWLPTTGLEGVLGRLWYAASEGGNSGRNRSRGEMAWSYHEEEMPLGASQYYNTLGGGEDG